MRRKLFTLVSVVSLILFVVTILLWLESHRTIRSLRFSCARFESRLLIDRGLLQVDFVNGDTEDRGFALDDFRRSAGFGHATLDMFGTGRWTRLGFGTWDYGRIIGGLFMGRSLSSRVIFMPLWSIVIVTAVAPGVWMINRRRLALHA